MATAIMGYKVGRRTGGQTQFDYPDFAYMQGGTVKYTGNLPLSSVKIILMQDGSIILGVAMDLRTTPTKGLLWGGDVPTKMTVELTEFAKAMYRQGYDTGAPQLWVEMG